MYHSFSTPSSQCINLLAPQSYSSLDHLVVEMYQTGMLNTRTSLPRGSVHQRRPLVFIVLTHSCVGLQLRSLHQTLGADAGGPSLLLYTSPSLPNISLGLPAATVTHWNTL